MGKIEIQDVSFCYDNKGNQFRALDHINLNIEEGEFISIIGRSGCGKSSLLRVISGLSRPTEGQILLDGQPIEAPSTKMAMVFQNYTLFPWMKVLQNITFGIRQADSSISKEEAKRRAMEMLNKVEMADAWNKYPYQLSGGMKQRVAIARALAMDSEVLLLDEPFGALDAKTRRSLRKLLENLWMNDKKQKTVIMVTHDVREAVKMGDRIVYMIPGHIKEVIPCPLPRPRNGIDTRYTCELQEMVDGLNRLFYQTEVTGETEADDEAD